MWHQSIAIDNVTMRGQIVKGFKRGSRQLGCPTANIEMTDENIKIAKDLVPGVYSALGQFINPTLDYIDPD
jgi:FAD synthase